MSKYSKKFHGEAGAAPSASATPASDASAKAGRHRLERRGTPAASERVRDAGGDRAKVSAAPREQTPSQTRAWQQEQQRQHPSPSSSSSLTGSQAPPAGGNGIQEGPTTVDAALAQDKAKNDHTEVKAERNDDESNDEGDEEEEEEDAEADIDAAVRGSDSATAHRALYTCDVCPHLVFFSEDALQQHAMESHADLFPDYERLQLVSSKLVPLWHQVRSRKADTISMWGRKIFHIARTRDAGPDKMAEAHRAREQLEHVVRRWHANARVFIFGSSVALGVWDGISDIDFAVVDVDEHEAGTWPPVERNAVRAITELLRRAGFTYVNLEPIPYARVPIIKHHASAPIRVAPATVAAALASQRHGDTSASAASGPPLSTAPAQVQPLTPAERAEASRLEAEDVVSRSVRYVLTAPASRQDRLVLEGSVRDAVGAEAVQQVWWNRTGEMMCVTCDTTLSAIRAATCGLAFVTPGLRARVQPVHDECRPELYNIDFDLSFRAFGIRNSELLNRYLTAHPCARPGAIVLKDWSKTSGVNNSMNGYLTSYAINIMWIYFLVQKGIVPYVDPTADVPASLAGRAHAGPTYRPMMPENLPPGDLDGLYREAGELLLGFFFFYCHEFNWREHVVSLNRRGLTTKRALGWDCEEPSSTSPATALGGPGAGAGGGGGGPGAPAGGPATTRRGTFGGTRYSFCIEDPYEENLNLGRHMGITKTLRVQAELHRGLLSLLKDGAHNSCVFTSTDRAEAATAAAAEQHVGIDPRSSAAGANSGGAGGGGGLLSNATGSGNAVPGRLPLAVLHKLMTVAMKEVAVAKQQQQVGAGVGSTEASTPFIGVRQEQLQAAFTAQAPLEYELACKAWNWQQLVHRLGYKLHRGCVLPRREIGVRRLRTNPQPPAGVVAASATSPASVAEGGVGSVSASTTLSEPRAGPAGLSDRLVAALANGFLQLTPEWVAWSKPWAAVHLRNHTFFTPNSPSPHASPTSSDGNSATATANAARTAAAAAAAHAQVHAPATAHGVRSTPPRLMWWRPGPGAGSPAPSTGAAVRRACRLLLHR